MNRKGILFVFFLILVQLPYLIIIVVHNYSNLSLLNEVLFLSYQFDVPVCPKESLTNKDFSMLTRFLESGIVYYPHAQINLGRLYWISGQCNIAYDIWVDVLSSNPDEMPAVVWLAWDGRQEQIPPAYHVKIGKYAMYKGDISLNAGSIEETLSWYNLALKFYPGRTAANSIIGVYEDLGNVNLILDTWWRVANALPKSHPEYWWALGQIAEIEKSWEDAASAYSSGAQLTDKPYDYLINAGQAYEHISDWKDAELSYLQAKDARTDQYIPYLYIGHLAFKQKDFNKAIEYYQIAQLIAPTNVLPLYHLGGTYYQLGHDVEAEKYLHESLRVHPQYHWSAYTLAMLYHSRGNTLEAIQYLSKAIEWNPSNTSSWKILLGDWWRELGDCEQAISTYKQAELFGASSAVIRRKLETLVGQCP